MKDLQKIYNQMPGIPMVVACFSMLALALLAGGYVSALSTIKEIRAEIAEIRKSNQKRLPSPTTAMPQQKIPVPAATNPPPVTQPAPKAVSAEVVTAAPEEKISALREPRMPEVEPVTAPPTRTNKNTEQQPEPAAPEVKKTTTPEVPEKIETIQAARPEPAVPVTSGISSTLMSGQILATSPEQMRVILSLGKSRGVKAGQRFNVYRADKWVGDIRVTKTYEEMAACEIVSTPRGLRMGDLVKSVDETSNSE